MPAARALARKSSIQLAKRWLVVSGPLVVPVPVPVPVAVCGGRDASWLAEGSGAGVSTGGGEGGEEEGCVAQPAARAATSAAVTGQRQPATEAHDNCMGAIVSCRRVGTPAGDGTAFDLESPACGTVVSQAKPIVTTSP